MSVIGSNILAGVSGQQGYTISRSVRLRSSASAYFNRTPASAGSLTTWTWSGWVKRGTLSASLNIPIFSAGTSGTNDTNITFNSDIIDWFNRNSSSINGRLNTTQVFRDPSAWYHLVFVWDTTNATASNRMRIYVNGSLVTALSTATYPGSSQSSNVNNNVATYIGLQTGTSNYFDGYLTEINFIDGQALTPSSFGTTNALTGVWQPAKYTGTYGTNGFYLNFSDNSSNTATTIGKDYSGNGNNWTPNNISVTSGVTYDSMLDVPTPYADGGNGRGNYAVLSPLDKGSNITLSNANLSSSNASSTNGSVRSTFGMSSGKWYWEVNVDATNPMIGISNASATLTDFPGVDANGWCYYGGNVNGLKYNNSVATNYGATFTTGDVIGVAFDADAGSLTFYKNGTSQGVAFSGLASNTYFAACGRGNGTAGVTYNFGQRPFTYTPPSGFVALNTYNLPAGTITTSGSFTGNASTDGPFVYLNGVPTAMTINGNAVTFGTNADHLANGFKVRSSSASYNASGSNTYSITTTGAKFKNAIAQTNP